MRKQELKNTLARALAAESALTGGEIDRKKIREEMQNELTKIQSALTERVNTELENERKAGRDARVRALQAEKDAREASELAEELQEELDRYVCMSVCLSVRMHACVMFVRMYAVRGGAGKNPTGMFACMCFGLFVWWCGRMLLTGNYLREGRGRNLCIAYVCVCSWAHPGAPGGA